MKGNIPVTDESMIPALENDSANKETEYIFPMLGDGVRVVEVKEVRTGINPRPNDSQETISDKSSESDISSDDSKSRATWGGQLEFLLTCIGYAVGLGNVWRFPYLCYKNGGGAFLIPYTIMLALVGLPLFYMELGLGQYASLGPIAVWKINPLFKGLGYGMVIVSWLIGLYYNVVISHVLYFLYSSFTDVLPWESCDNAWNTEHCMTFEQHQNARNGTFNATLRNITGSKTPSEEFYRNHVLSQTESIDDFGTIEWKLVLCLLVAWTVVCLVLLRGIQSLGKVVYFTAIFPYIMLTILLIRGLTLPGAGQGLIYYLKPDFNRLLDPRVWNDAATQIFYSLSACSGGLIAMASYNKFNNNCYRDAMIVCFINCGTSVFAGMVIFSVLGFMAAEKGVGVADVADDGPGLAFVVYPEALSRMPVSPLWSVFFFIMMATLGFGSEFSIVECVFSALSDEFPILKSKRNNIIFRVVGCFVCFLLGLPMVFSGGIWLLNLVDYSVGGFPLLVVGLMELIALSWIYGFDQFSDNLYIMVGRKPNKYWEICWKYVSPLVITVTILLNIILFKEPELDDVFYPAWANGLGWLIALFPIVVIPGWFLYKYCREGGYLLMKDKMKPLPTWGPATVTKKEYPGIEVTYCDGKPGYNPALARLMGSNISTSTNDTDITSVAGSAITINKVPSGVLDLKRNRDPSESSF